MRIFLLSATLLLTYPLVALECDMLKAKQYNLEFDYDRCIEALWPCFDAGNAEAGAILGLAYLTEYYGHTDYEKGKDILLKTLAMGDAKANLGMAYYYTYHPTQANEEKADQFFLKAIAPVREASNAGDIFWTSKLAFMYSHGYGVEQDEYENFELLNSLRDAGYPIAWHNLAYAYGKGKGVDMNYDSAYKYYSKAYHAGFESSSAGILDLATYYFYGDQTEIDIDKSIQLLEEIKSYDSRNANLLLGLGYFHRGDKQKGIDFFTEAQKKDSILGYPLAYCLLNSTAPDFETARQLIDSWTCTDDCRSNGTVDYLKSLLHGNPSHPEYFDKDKAWAYLKSAHKKGFNFYFEPDHQPVIGDSLRNLVLEDTNGDMVALDTLTAKYTLIDFWASWCGPCRYENPNLVRAYEKYYPMGFDIVGISLDESKQRWLVSIEKDGLSWNHMSDLAGWESIASWEYGITAIPQSFLVDQSGNIIGKNLRGEALWEKLKELFEE